MLWRSEASSSITSSRGRPSIRHILAPADAAGAGFRSLQRRVDVAPFRPRQAVMRPRVLTPPARVEHPDRRRVLGTDRTRRATSPRGGRARCRAASTRAIAASTGDGNRPAAGRRGFAVTLTSEPDRLVVIMYGDLDVSTAPTLRFLTVGALAGGCSRITIDLEQVGFCDSSGLRALV